MVQIYNQTSPLQIAREVFDIESATLGLVKSQLDSSFEKSVELILQVKGRVVVTGMGKSGHIGAKIAATLASTGTPAFFVHPAEMGHGDLGMLKSDDLVLALSFSGNTDELKKVLPAIKKLGVPLISITAGKDSALARVSDCVLLTPITQEACPLDLAPTSSTTATLVMGDALAVALMKAKNFQAQDFARSHPLGSLGRSFIQISQIMRTTEIPSVNSSANLQEILQEIDQKSLGFTVVTDIKGEILGIITDGDLRRAQIKFGAEVFNKLAFEIMNKNPKTITPDTLATQAAEILKSYRISSLIVVDNQKIPLGTLDLKDMLAEGFVI
jgi:arabinose-5-phosphate isomerase